MRLIVLTAVLTLAVGVFGDGEVIFLSKPSSIEFRGHEKLDPDNLKDIASLSLGFTSYSTSEWPGVYITDPFHFAEVVVVVNVHGVPSLGIREGHKFKLETSSALEELRPHLEGKILDRFPPGDNQSMVEIDLEEDVRAAEISLNKGVLKVQPLTSSFLKDGEDVDSSFLSQIALLRAAIDKIEEKGVVADGLPDFYWFNLKGLHPIMDYYGADSNTAQEALEMTAATLGRMTEVFDQLYPNKTLVMVIASDTAHTRRYRRQSPDLIKDRNLAPVYDENYPVLFNIFLWFTIAFIMTIIAVSMATATMDPGRDSIIYRMTSTRMKKDN